MAQPSRSAVVGALRTLAVPGNDQPVRFEMPDVHPTFENTGAAGRLTLDRVRMIAEQSRP